MAHFSQLSIGLIIKSTKIWSWQHDLVQSLITKQLIRVSQVHVIASDPPELPRSIAILHKLDSMVFQSVMTAFKVVELDLSSVQKGSYSESSDGEGVDLWINLSERMVDNELSKTARLGLLGSHFSESSCGCETNSANFGYFEFSRREKQCYFSVVLQHPNGSKYVLSESRPSLDKGSLSRNMNQYWGLLEASWVRVCQQLQMSTVGSIPNNKVLIKNADRFECPEFSSFQAYQNLILVLLEKITQKFFRKEQWVLLLHFRDQSVNEEIPLSFADYQKIMPPKDCFWADPFIVTKDGRHYVFFEELPYTTECGHLSCLEVFADGSHSEPRVILKKPYHLSYPNVFSHDGNYYMVPESGDAGLITLYRCKAFPYEWEQERVLIDNLHAYDTTLLEYQGKGW